MNKFLLFLLLSFISIHTNAQSQAGVRVSVLTCGSGNDLYSVYGHTAIRIIDSVNGDDMVFNYGTFNFSDPDFYLKFTRGKLEYYLDVEQFNGFMNTYEQEGRSMHEQVLNLSKSDALKLQAFLFDNMKEENKYYKYDFLFDNCSTRVRNIFDSLYGNKFQYGKIISDDSASFRDVLDYYERNIHWERFGINLLLSNKVDDKMKNKQIMFLPDYLEKGLASAYIGGLPLVKETKILLPDQINHAQTPNQVILVFWGLLMFIYIISRYKPIANYLIYFDILLFMILGLLGCFMLFMWLGTEHASCAWNRNLMWAFPLHFVFAILLAKNSEKVSGYAQNAFVILLVSMIYGMFATQKYQAELTPLLILILWRLFHHMKLLKTFSSNILKSFT